VDLTQEPGGAVLGHVQGAADTAPVQRQVARILCLDHSGEASLEVGRRDPVIERLQRELPGLRPVLFHSPYEAAASSIIATRRRRAAQAAP